MCDAVRQWFEVVRIGWRVERHTTDAAASVPGCPVKREAAVEVPIAAGVVAYVPRDPMAHERRPHAVARDVLVIADHDAPIASLQLLGLPITGDRILVGQTWYTVACVAVSTFGCGVV